MQLVKICEAGQKKREEEKQDEAHSPFVGPLWASALAGLVMEHTENVRLKLYFIGNNYKRQLASFQSQAFQSQLVIEKWHGAGEKSPATKRKLSLWSIGRFNK